MVRLTTGLYSNETLKKEAERPQRTREITLHAVPLLRTHNGLLAQTVLLSGY
jgi:hypothetical protein